MTKVLVIDDETTVRKAVQFHLKKHGHDPFEAADGESGLAIVRREHPAVVLVDISMPGIDGIEVLKRIREEKILTEVIMITGNEEADMVVQALRKGAFDYFGKPVNPDKLEISIKKALKKQETQRLLDEHVCKLKTTNEQLEQEISKRKQLEQSAKLAALGELAAGIAHEINNPLSFIYANLGNLNKFFLKIRSLIESYDKLAVPDDAKKEIEEIKEGINYTYLKTRIIDMIEKSIDGASRIKKIVTDMKTFARVDSADIEYANLNASIDTTLGILVHEYKNRVEINRDFDLNLPEVKCFVAKLNQVFLNLLVNACQAIEEKGVICIRTSTNGDNVVIEIEDSGGGIPDDVKERIFNPFFTTKPVGKGTGLGLSISHDIIQQHKGELSVTSKTGEGTTFTIQLPIDGGGS